jgi:hypothetical protein
VGGGWGSGVGAGGGWGSGLFVSASFDEQKGGVGNQDEGTGDKQQAAWITRRRKTPRKQPLFGRFFPYVDNNVNVLSQNQPLFLTTPQYTFLWILTQQHKKCTRGTLFCVSAL